MCGARFLAQPDLPDGCRCDGIHPRLDRSNSGAGSVSVVGDRVEFLDSSLCAGTGVYRWTIADGTLSFFPLETEPCPGRAEALLVRYSDYSPPSDD